MVMQFGEDEEFGDEHPDDTMTCVCVNYDDENGDAHTNPGAPPGGNQQQLLPIGDPPVISCHLLIHLLDDALNMIR
jgi:hypothetical protein